MKIRAATKNDLAKLLALHQNAATTIDGLARTKEEITGEYVENFLNNSLKNGLIFVSEDHEKNLLASIHCYKFEPKCFKHCLGNLVIAVHPDFHNQGIGKKLFTHLLENVMENHRDIARVELFVRQTNPRGLALYQKLGFEIEGICKNRILDGNGEMSSDTMMAWFNPNFVRS